MDESLERGVDHGSGDEWTISDTAKEIAKVQDRPVDGVRKDVTRAMVVAKHLAAGNEVVKNARSAREAYDIISRQTEQDFTAALAKATGGKTEHVFMQGDMRELIWPDTLDCVIADLPYGVGADQFGNAGGTHLYDDSTDAAMELYKFVASKSFEMTKPSAHLYLFCDIISFNSISKIVGDMGWTVFRTPAIWFKGSQGFDPKPGIGFRRTYEAILFAWKGDRPAKSLVNDVIGGVSGLPVGSSHAAAKPVELYRQLLARTCNPADRVLDPCCGSGTIFPAATQVGCNAWGMELNESYAKAADARRFSKN
jgi:hypothetical protein